MAFESIKSPDAREAKSKVIKIEDLDPKDLYKYLYGWRDIGELDTGIGVLYGYSIGSSDTEEWDFQIDKYGLDKNGGILFIGDSGGTVQLHFDSMKTVEFSEERGEVKFKGSKGTYTIGKYGHEFTTKDGFTLFEFRSPVSAAPGDIKAL